MCCDIVRPEAFHKIFFCKYRVNDYHNFCALYGTFVAIVIEVDNTNGHDTTSCCSEGGELVKC